MKQDFYYADYDLTVTITEGKSGFLKSVNKCEMQALQLNLWHAISAFYTARSLFHASLIDKNKYDYLKDEGKEDEPDGG